MTHPTNMQQLEQTETAWTREEIRAAASFLAKMPRHQRRRWSGWLNPKKPYTRLWRGRRIILPDGEVCFAYGSLRGQVVWSRHENGLHGGLCGEPFEWGVLPASEIRLWKNPQAVLLGALKLGIREKPSLAKQIAARVNGARPCRPGRKRGRPSKLKTFSQATKLDRSYA